MANEDLYKVLGVDADADQSTIKQAYRSLVRQHHPDTSPDRNNSDSFQLIQKAYEILSDSTQRKEYDDSRKKSFKSKPKIKKQPNIKARPSTAFKIKSRIIKTSEIDGHDTIKDSIQNKNPEESSADEKEKSSGIFDGLKNLFNKSEETASTLAGRQDRMTMTISALDSLRSIRQEITIETPNGTQKETIQIPAGVADGTELELRSLATKHLLGGKMSILVRVNSHPLVSRESNDIVLRIPIKPLEAIEGASLLIPTLTGAVAIQLPARHDLSKRLRLKGKGLQNTSGKTGDLYIIPFIQLPEGNEETLKQIFSHQLFGEQDPRKDVPKKL